MRLPFGLAPAGKMFESKIDEIFKDLPNVFDIADDILIVGYNVDGKDHDRTLKQVMQICHYENVTLNKSKCHFRNAQVLFLGEKVSHQDLRCKWTLENCMCLMICHPSNTTELQSSLGTIYYPGTFAPATAEVCEPLRKLTSMKTEWMWNRVKTNMKKYQE